MVKHASSMFYSLLIPNVPYQLKIVITNVLSERICLYCYESTDKSLLHIYSACIKSHHSCNITTYIITTFRFIKWQGLNRNLHIDIYRSGVNVGKREREREMKHTHLERWPCASGKWMIPRHLIIELHMVGRFEFGFVIKALENLWNKKNRGASIYIFLLLFYFLLILLSFSFFLFLFFLNFLFFSSLFFIFHFFLLLLRTFAT
jgi:hypothetical protein